MHIHFVTGRLAEHALEKMLRTLAPEIGFTYSIDVLKITVAALMTPQWISDRIKPPENTDRIILPGYCLGELTPIETSTGLPVERGPRDLRRLPEHFGRKKENQGYGEYSIEILSEINHAPLLSLPELIRQAQRLHAAGANLIDLGCNPGQTWAEVGDAVKALRDVGLRVSIDSLNPDEIEPAVKAGAELVLSVNSSNRERAVDWGCEVVAIPDVPQNLEGLAETIDFLADARVKLRIDPILEPIGCGFAASLGRYLEVRRRWPDAEIMMGIGNLTELTDADSAGINVLLLGICAELGIHSVLTTEVINWARTSTRECDLARRLVHYAVEQSIPPKNLESDLVLLRDPRLLPVDPQEMKHLSKVIKDNNYRMFTDEEDIHLISSDLHLQNADPFLLFDQLMKSKPGNIDPSHAFYLGFEMCKALTAITLGKQYEQDEALRWGFLTREEKHHRLSGRKRSKSDKEESDDTESPNAE